MKNTLLSFAKQELVRGSVFVFIGSLIAGGLNSLFHVITGNMLGPEEYSIVASLISLSYIISFIAQLINTITAQKVAALSAKKDTARIKGFVLSMGRNVLIVSTLLLIGFLILQDVIADFLNIADSSLVLLLGLSFAISLFMVLVLSLFQGQLRFIAHSAISSLVSAIKVGSAIVVIILGFGPGGVMWGLVIANIVTVLVAGYMMRPILAVRAKAVRPKLSSYYSRVWIVLALLGMGLLINADIMLVKHFYPDYEAGLYAGLATMGKIMLFFASSITIALLPIVSKKHEQGKSVGRELLFAQGLIVALSLVVLVAYLIMPEFIVKILYGSEYISIASYMWLIGIYFMCYNMALTFTNYFIARGRRWILAAPFVISGIQIAGIYMYHDTYTEVLSVMIASALLLIAWYTGYFFIHEQKK